MFWLGFGLIKIGVFRAVATYYADKESIWLALLYVIPNVKRVRAL